MQKKKKPTVIRLNVFEDRYNEILKLAPKIRGHVITIPKMAAARRQLKTAIVLWFCDGDPISIHTLAAAAFGVIDGVHRIKKKQSFLSTLDIFHPEDERKVIALFNGPQDLFKHAAGRNRGELAAEIKFDTRTTIHLINYCLFGLESLGIRRNGYESVFGMYYELNYPDFLSQYGKDRIKKFVPVEDLEKIRAMTKGEFFQWMTPLLDRI